MQQATTTIRNSFMQQAINSVKPVLDFFRSDARHYQILFQLTFLLFGIFALGWNVNLLSFNVMILTCMAVQAIGIHFTTKDYAGLKSALISSFSLCLMFHANSIWVFALAAVLSIGSKYIFRWKGKHIFNPTNFGIVVTILITGDAWISPGQWGSQGLLLFIVGITGLVVLLRVRRLDTALAFLITFLGLHFCREILYKGWPMDSFTHILTSGSLLLFSFFMITDPVQTPANRWARIGWAAAIGAVAWYMQAMMQIQHAAPIWALFFLSPLVPVLDYFLPGKRFQWVTPAEQATPAAASGAEQLTESKS